MNILVASWVYSDLRLIIISQENPWNAWDWREITQPATQKTNFESLMKIYYKTAVKHSIKKPKLLYFVDLSTRFCPWLKKAIG